MKKKYDMTRREGNTMEELVSIIVISYNAQNTIIETLDSVYKQKYINLELIIADDCSKDNTKQLAEEWIKQNSGRFQNIKTIFSKINQGVTLNIINGIQEATGKWIKCIAADDILLENCIQDNVSFAQKNNAQIVFSNMQYFSNRGLLNSNSDELRKQLQKFCQKTIEQQKGQLIKENVLPAPSAFFSIDLYNKVEGFDQEIKMMEDWPFWIRISQNGIKIYYMDKFTVKYRVSETSVSHSHSFYQVQQQVKRKYCYPNIPKYCVWYYYHEKVFKMKCRLQNNLIVSSKKYKILEIIYAILWPIQLLKILKWKLGK